MSAGVWEEVPRSEVPSGRAVIPSHVIFKIKTVEDKATGRLVVEKLKARLVYGGHRSVAGQDYHETAAYTASAKAVTLMACRAHRSKGARRGTAGLP